jgi:hypothetical protein
VSWVEQGEKKGKLEVAGRVERFSVGTVLGMLQCSCTETYQFEFQSNAKAVTMQYKFYGRGI